MSRELYAAVRSQTYKALLLLVSSCGFTTTTRSGVALVKQLLLWLGLSALTGGKPLPPVEPVTHTYLDAYRAALRVHRWNNQPRAPAVSDLFKVFVSVKITALSVPSKMVNDHPLHKVSFLAGAGTQFSYGGLIV